MEKITALQPLFIFIGGHPMAGSEQGGIEAADPNLFENAVYVLTPSVKMQWESSLFGSWPS